MEYVLVGDYYIPDLILPHEERPIGKYGRMHREYLKEHNPMRFHDLVLEGQPWTYLAGLHFRWSPAFYIQKQYFLCRQKSEVIQLNDIIKYKHKNKLSVCEF